MPHHHILIFGPAGAGSTTLGQQLSAATSVPCFDTDEFYWIREEDGTLYKRKRNPEHRRKLLTEALALHSDWILTGSLNGWGDVLIPEFTLVIFLFADTEIRLERIRKREIIRYGEQRIQQGGDLHAVFNKFLQWASDYDGGGMEMKSKSSDEAWMEKISCPILRLNGNDPPEANLRRIIDEMNK